MGGDDLGSDDEFFTAPVVGGSLDSDTDDDTGMKNDLQASGRKRSSVREYDSDNDNHTTRKDTEKSKSSNKRKRGRRGDGGQLEEVGYRIVNESCDRQANLISDFVGVTFSSHNIAQERPDHQMKHVNNDNSNENSDSLADRLISFISKKQLKKPPQQQQQQQKQRKNDRHGSQTSSTGRSPRVIILAMSARRAVAILKELAPLRIQIAKLFPKQGTCQQQAQQLAETNFIAAVGTPQRIAELLDNKALPLHGTQLVLLDTFHNDKGFQVYTLPDTKSFCADVLRDHVHPECAHRPKRIKVGFL